MGKLYFSHGKSEKVDTLTPTTIEDGYIVLRPPKPHHQEQGYCFELSRCKTQEQLLHWTLHIGEKTWMDKRSVLEFIRVVSYHYNWKVFG